MKPRVVAVVPARMGSRRFPGKVIYPYRGKPLLFYLLDEVRKSKLIDRLIVATDSQEVRKVLGADGAEVIMTAARHRTGSDRAAEVVQKVGGSIILNIQADNIGLKAPVLDRIIKSMLANRNLPMATLCRRLDTEDELFDPNVVKLVTDRGGDVLWFSRFPIPYLQGFDGTNRAAGFPFLKHVGVYFFRRAALERFASWKRTPLEKAESLEQLRILENGEKIKAFMTRVNSVSVDSPEDLEKIAL